MKKRIAICTTIIAFVVFAAVLGVSVYAAVSKGFGINNTISFEGGGSTLHFELYGWVDGMVRDESPDGANKKYWHNWDFNGNSENPEDRRTSDEWTLGNLVFDNKGKKWDECYISYSFKITNYGINDIIISYAWEGSAQISSGLDLRTYVYDGDDETALGVEGNSIQIAKMGQNTPKTARLTVMLTLAEKDFVGSQLFDNNCRSLIKTSKNQPKAGLVG